MHFVSLQDYMQVVVQNSTWYISKCIGMYIGINGKTGILSSSVKSQFHKKNSIKIKSQSSSVRSRSSPRSERCFSYHSHWGQTIKTEVDLQQTQKLRLFEFVAAYTAVACQQKNSIKIKSQYSCVRSRSLPHLESCFSPIYNEARERRQEYGKDPQKHVNVLSAASFSALKP